MRHPFPRQAGRIWVVVSRVVHGRHQHAHWPACWAAAAGNAAVLTVALTVLTFAAALRSAEYDEQYTLFLTAGMPRPDWPSRVVTAAEIIARQSGPWHFAEIAGDLRRTDVHPPIYFWLVAAWRDLVGSGLLAARMLSVLLSVVALGLTAAIARRIQAPPALAMAITLGCYGFAYTGSVARSFALTQVLILGAVLRLIRPPVRCRPHDGLLAGSLLGTAMVTNYLASFVAAAVIACVSYQSISGGTLHRSMSCKSFQPDGRCEPACRSALGLAVFLPFAGYFYLAQSGSRDGQFPPFSPLSAGLRLALYGAANLTGGLPLYVHDTWHRLASAGLIGLIAGLVSLVVLRWRRIATEPQRRLVAACALAPPVGLFALGLVFDRTPIELRYLAFSTPFAGLLLAAAIASLTRRAALFAGMGVLAVQALAIGGLVVKPETMQPAQAVAREAAALANGAPVLVPFGNDGVGIVGAFAREAPPGLSMLIIRRVDISDTLSTRLAPYRRIVLARLEQDAESRATLEALRAFFAGPCWRKLAGHGLALSFEHTCGGMKNVLRGSDARENPVTRGADAAATQGFRAVLPPAAR
jgi:hypothetical protein